jgi:hypothetical protein
LPLFLLIISVSILALRLFFSLEPIWLRSIAELLPVFPSSFRAPFGLLFGDLSLFRKVIGCVGRSALYGRCLPFYNDLSPFLRLDYNLSIQEEPYTPHYQHLQRCRHSSLAFGFLYKFCYFYQLLHFQALPIQC